MNPADMHVSAALTAMALFFILLIVGTCLALWWSGFLDEYDGDDRELAEKIREAHADWRGRKYVRAWGNGARRTGTRVPAPRVPSSAGSRPAQERPTPGR